MRPHLKKVKEMEQIGSAVAGTSGYSNSHKHFKASQHEKRPFIGRVNWRHQGVQPQRKHQRGRHKAKPGQEVESESLDHEQVGHTHAMPSSLLSDTQTEVSPFLGGRLKHFSEN